LNRQIDVIAFKMQPTIKLEMHLEKLFREQKRICHQHPRLSMWKF
jgi:hypothetical protein